MKDQSNSRSRRARSTVGTAALAVAMVAALGGGAAPQAGAEPLTAGPQVRPLTIGTSSWGTSWSYNPWSSSYLWDGIVGWCMLPLTIQEPTAPDSFFPELATSWKDVNGTLEVYLRQGVHWSNGQLFTSQDVVTTTLLDGLDDGTPWQDITSVTAAGPYQVNFKLVPGIPLSVAEPAILYNGTPVPAGLYSKFLSPATAKLIVSHDNQLRVNPSTPASKTLEADYKALVSFNPPTVFCDGPYLFKAANSSAILLVKNPNYYGAANVHPPEVEWLATSSATEFGEMMAGDIDLPYIAPTATELGALLKSGFWHVKTGPNSQYWAIWLNNRRPPLNLVAVRQALAYLLHRPELVTIQDGKPVMDRYVTHPDMLNNLDSIYLTKAQLDSLNTYSYNPAKAAQLLNSVGFHKVKGQWLLPDGKPFTIALDIPAGYTNSEEVGIAMSHWLDNFGIKTTASAIPSATFGDDFLTGQYQVLWGVPTGYGFFSPFSQLVGPVYTTNPVTDPGIGFPAVDNVPGIGRVNVLKTLLKEADTIPSTPGPQTDRLVWDWAKYWNSQVPIIEYADRYVPRLYSTKNYVDWPPDNTAFGKTLWAIDAEAAPGFLELAMVQSGYVRPR